MSMSYAEAERILDDWDFYQLPDGQKVIDAIIKAKQAIRQCSRNVEVTIIDHDNKGN